MKEIFTTLILLYQKIISPDHGFLKTFFPYGYCRFYPTCSEYMRQSISYYGLVKGIIKGCRRLGMCHPWQKGGIHLVD